MALMQILRPQRPTYMMTWQVGFVERALRGERIHWTQIFWTVTRHHIGLLSGGSPSYLSPFLINFYRGMNLLTAEESRSFPMRNVEQEGEERTVFFEMRAPDSRARSKMKARRLILDDDSSPESGRTVRKNCSNQEARSVEKAAQSKDEPIKKKSCTEKGRSTSVEKSRASRRAFEKSRASRAILTEDVPLKRRYVPEEKTQWEEPRAEAAEVLTVSSDTKEDPVALEEVAAKAVEDVAAAEGEPQKATSSWTSTDTIILEKSEEPSVEKTQSAALNAVDVLSVQVLLLLQYLDWKREKYA
ncbi:hypothetical protein AXG93_942s1190 [Marchantia polymorpha subsp. ruderalis]|uniref:Uncharacterized protein n=1 Tax=Marchantia polymorpha subsp. ruderalis TaxID=1480154 RepID=A0A176WEB7_MARPO|nr:hypothetical protein AXG93_942s1190 [Marchantia polymorpha subsp. ruderalis]